MSTDSVVCPVCACKKTRRWFKKKGYVHQFCPECQFGFVYPVPSTSAIDDYYNTLDSGLSSDCSWETEPRHKLQLWHRLLGRVIRLSGQGPLLDLGCGAGQFLRLAQDSGWKELVGVEIAEKAVDMARSSVDAKIYHASWTEVSLDNDRFAGVALFDVLEHAPNPAALLRYLYACLRPGGSLLITVPNTRGLSIRCFGHNSCVVIPPEHLSYFTRKSLARLLESAGFAVAYHTTCDLYLKEWIRFLPGAAGEEKHGSTEAASRETYARWYQRLSGNAFLWAIGGVNVGLAATGLGDQLVCIARKPQ